MSEAVGWSLGGLLLATLLAWGIALVRAVASARAAERALAAARQAGDPATCVILEQRAADRALRVRRLTRWVQRRGARRRAA